MADAQDLGSCAERRVGSSPISCTSAAMAELADVALSKGAVERRVGANPTSRTNASVAEWQTQRS